MSEPVTKQRPSIDFDESERTIRDAAQPSRAQPRGQEDDPLAELARLVGTHHDPYGEVFAQNEAQQPEARRPSIDFAAIEAGLRGTIPAHEAHAAQGHDQYAHDDQNYYDQHDPSPADGDAGWYDHAQDAPPVAPRSRRPIYAMAAVILVGVVGIGVAFAYKGSNSGPREIAMIKAAPGPTKIQPPADGSADQPNSDASMLDKAQQPAPTKLASHEEQPVDLAQTVQNAPRDVGLAPLYNFGAANNAASVPVPAPPGQADQKPAMGIAGDIEPIRVKTRSYRPDGTPIPNDQPPAAAMAAAPPPASKADKAAIAKASTPKSATPKSTTRVAVTPKAKPTVTADAGDTTPTDLNAAAAAPAPHKVKPVKAPAKPVETASATDATDDAAQTASVPAGGGGFAVQLAAPGSEAEAKAASTKLSAKFASALSGHHLSFHKADSNGKAVYRVRVGSLSREEATGICEKLKSSGGSCFVAKN